MTSSEKFFYWSPRTLSIGYVLFLSIFALDVFSANSGLGVVVPLLIHLIPSTMLLLVIIIAWKYELVGAILFIGFALWYVWDVGFTKPLSWYIAIALPASITGLLYLSGWVVKKKELL